MASWTRAANRRVNLGSEPAASAPGPHPHPPVLILAACGCARITVLSSSNHSRSGSWNASKIALQRPFWHHRLNRWYTEFHLPYTSGRSRQPMPVLARYRMAFMNRLGRRAAGLLERGAGERVEHRPAVPALVVENRGPVTVVNG